MSENELVHAIAPVIRLFEQLAVKSFVGGSLVSSAFGVPRTTLAADLVADLKPHHAATICQSLAPTYYISRPMVESAIDRQSCFNLIHWDTMFKIDVFVGKDRDFDRTALTRIQRETIGPDENQLAVFLASPEDIVLNKLQWYRLGDEVSQRQWSDAVSVLTMQHTSIDRGYLMRWAGELGITNLLRRALAEADLG